MQDNTTLTISSNEENQEITEVPCNTDQYIESIAVEILANNIEAFKKLAE